MQYIVPAVPLLLLAGIVALILRSGLRGRVALRRPVRAARPRPQAQKRATLRVVSPDQMDADLQDLIRKR
jgi:hypothetical protein